MKALNTKLLETQAKLKAELEGDGDGDMGLAEKRAMVESLKEQLHDLKFYVNTRHKLKNSHQAHDLNTGTIVMVDRHEEKSKSKSNETADKD